MTLETLIILKKFCIWVHCSSMGEFEQIKPLLKKIKKTKPITEFVITFFLSRDLVQLKNFRC